MLKGKVATAVLRDRKVRERRGKEDEKSTYVVHGVQVLLVVGEIESAKATEGFRLALPRRCVASLVAVGLLEKEGELVGSLALGSDRPLRLLPEAGLEMRAVANVPSCGAVDAAIPAELATLVLAPLEGDNEDAAVGNRVEVEETDDGADHLRFRNTVEHEVLVDAETAHLSVRRLGLRARAVEVRVVEAVGTERREDGKVGLVLEEEAEVPKRLTGRVTGREVVAEYAVEDEGVALGFVAVLDGRRERLVVDELDVLLGDEDVATLRVLRVNLRLLSRGSRRGEVGRWSRLAVPKYAADETERCADPARRTALLALNDVGMDELPSTVLVTAKPRTETSFRCLSSSPLDRPWRGEVFGTERSIEEEGGTDEGDGDEEPFPLAETAARVRLETVREVAGATTPAEQSVVLVIPAHLQDALLDLLLLLRLLPLRTGEKAASATVLENGAGRRGEHGRTLRPSSLDRGGKIGVERVRRRSTDETSGETTKRIGERRESRRCRRKIVRREGAETAGR
jgi:hypothetical protein